MSHVPTWLITGTSNGFGLALARHVLSESHKVISVSRHKAPHESLTSIVSASGKSSSLHHLQLDLADKDESKIKSAVTQFLICHPDISVDILVNNAAITAFAPVETTPTSTVETVMTVNFYSPLWMIQAVLPHMRTSKNGTGKVVVNISSTQGLCCAPSELAYEASKHALEGMSGVLATEISPFGIRTMIVNLGSFRTAFATSGDRAGLSAPIVPGPGGADDPYENPEHPVKMRMEMVMKYAKIPTGARGDPKKGVAVLFDGVMKAPGTEANAALQKQRGLSSSYGTGVEKLERLVLGSDGLSVIERSLAAITMQVESCKDVSSMADADDLSK